MRCSLCYANTVQTECRASNLFVCFAEVQPVLCKYSANRVQSIKLVCLLCRGAACIMQIQCKPSAKHQTCLFALPRCSLYYANTVQTECKASNLFVCFAEVQPVLCKFIRNNRIRRHQTGIKCPLFAQPSHVLSLVCTMIFPSEPFLRSRTVVPARSMFFFAFPFSSSMVESCKATAYVSL